jgi:hypothetical protein
MLRLHDAAGFLNAAEAPPKRGPAYTFGDWPPDAAGHTMVTARLTQIMEFSRRSGLKDQ